MQEQDIIADATLVLRNRKLIRYVLLSALIGRYKMLIRIQREAVNYAHMVGTKVQKTRTFQRYKQVLVCFVESKRYNQGSSC